MRKAIFVLSLTALMAVSVPSMAATQTITAVGATFVPPAALASSNDTIQLRNSDVLPHTLTLIETAPLGGKFCRDSLGNAIKCTTGIVSGGGSGSFNLVSAPAGSYQFICELHRNMTGVLVIR